MSVGNDVTLSQVARCHFLINFIFSAKSSLIFTVVYLKLRFCIRLMTKCEWSNLPTFTWETGMVYAGMTHSVVWISRLFCHSFKYIFQKFPLEARCSKAEVCLEILTCLMHWVIGHHGLESSKVSDSYVTKLLIQVSQFYYTSGFTIKIEYPIHRYKNCDNVEAMLS